MAQRITLNTIGKQGPIGPEGPAGPAGGSDAATAEHVTTGPLTSAALSATIEQTFSAPQTPQINPLATAKRGRMPRILSLLTGSNDEQGQGYMTNGTIAVDTVNYKFGGRGWKFTTNTGAPWVKWTMHKPAPGETAPLAMPAWQAMCMWVYIPDVTKVTYLQVNLFGDATLTAGNRWTWSSQTAPTVTLTTGWNFIRIPASFSSVLPTGNIYQAEFLAAVNADTNVTVGHWYFECPEKARFILTEDRGYKTFYDNLYPQFVERGWPVTFAVDCTRFGDNAGTIGEAMTLAQMKACAQENGNSISFHGWDGAPTAAMTADQLRADTLKSIKFLQREFPDSMGRFWRAAYVQNSAAQWAAMTDYLLAAAAATGTTIDNGPTMWPPNNLHHIPRWNLDNYKTLGNITDLFAQAEATRLTYNVFLHGYDTTEPSWDVNQARWELFRDSLDTAVAEGWAECVTFEQLFLESGGTFRTIGGATVAEYTDVSGARVVKTLL